MADHRVAFERVYAADTQTAELVGAFAHAIVLAAVSPEDWQFGEDAEDLAVASVRDCRQQHPDASTVRVNVVLDVDEQFLEVHVAADNRPSRPVRATPRRPFVTRSVGHLLDSGRSG